MITRYPRCAWSFQTRNCQGDSSPSSPCPVWSSKRNIERPVFLMTWRPRIMAIHSSLVSFSPKITAAARMVRKKPCVTTRMCSSGLFSRNFNPASARVFKSSKFSPSSNRYPGVWKLSCIACMAAETSGAFLSLPCRLDGNFRSVKKSENSSSFPSERRWSPPYLLRERSGLK